MFYRLQFIYSARFMASSLSNPVSNLAEGTGKIKCKYGHDDKKCETCGCEHFLEYAIVKDDVIEYKSLCCNRNH